MKVLRATVAAGVLAGSWSCGDAVALRLHYRPTAGSTFHYELEQRVQAKIEEGSTPKEPNQDMTIIIAFTQSVTGPVAGGTEVRLRVDSVGLSSSQLPPEALASAGQILQGLVSAIVFDDRMQVVRATLVERGGTPAQLAEQLSAGLRGASVVLPEGPIQVGGTWTSAAPAPLGQVPGLTEPLMLTSRLRLKRFRVEGADTIVTIEVETSFPRDPIRVVVEGDSGSIKIAGSLRGAQEYSLKRQALITSIMGGTVRTQSAGDSLGHSRVTIDQRVSVRLVRDGSTP